MPDADAPGPAASDAPAPPASDSGAPAPAPSTVEGPAPSDAGGLDEAAVRRLVSEAVDSGELADALAARADAAVADALSAGRLRASVEPLVSDALDRAGLEPDGRPSGPLAKALGEIVAKRLEAIQKTVRGKPDTQQLQALIRDAITGIDATLNTKVDAKQARTVAREVLDGAWGEGVPDAASGPLAELVQAALTEIRERVKQLPSKARVETIVDVAIAAHESARPPVMADAKAREEVRAIAQDLERRSDARRPDTVTPDQAREVARRTFAELWRTDVPATAYAAIRALIHAELTDLKKSVSMLPDAYSVRRLVESEMVEAEAARPRPITDLHVRDIVREALAPIAETARSEPAAEPLRRLIRAELTAARAADEAPMTAVQVRALVRDEVARAGEQAAKAIVERVIAALGRG